jgi:hypothetical protein
MNPQVRLKKVENKFHFDFVNEDKDLEKYANLKLLQLLAYAPPGATGVGLVEKYQGEFLSTITIQSHYRSFTAKAIGSDAKAAVRKSLDRLEDELFRWRFGGGSGNNGRHTGIPTVSHLPLAGSV